MKKSSLKLFFGLLILMFTLVSASEATSSGWNHHRCDMSGSRFYNSPSTSKAKTDLELDWSAEGNGSLLTGDVTGDGNLEVITYNGHNIVMIYDSEGNLLRQITNAEYTGSNRSFSPSLIADYDGDGIKDIGIGTGSRNYVNLPQSRSFFYNSNGTQLAQFDCNQADNKDSWMFPIAVLENKVFTQQGMGYDRTPRGLVAYDQTNTSLLWHYKVGREYNFNLAYDGSALKIVTGGVTVHNGGSGCGVNGNATCTNDGNLYTIAIDSNGNEIFTQNYSGNGNPNGYVDSCFVDIDQDGDMEVISFEGHNNYYHGTGQIHILDGTTGAYLDTFNAPYDTMWRNYAFGDLDNDGRIEIAATSSAPGGYTQYLLDQNLNVIASSNMSGEIHCASDINGSGQADLLMADGDTLRITDLQFNEWYSWDAGSKISSIIVSDLDGDSVNEIILVTTNNNLQVLKSVKSGGGVVTEAQLLFRERDAGVPGFDHVGLYPGNGESVWESHKGYDDDEYWDPDVNDSVSVHNNNGVQQEHSRGSFKYDALVGNNSPVTDFDSVEIDETLAQNMAAKMQSQLGAGYINWYEWAPIVSNSFGEPWLQKGGLGTYSCVGLTEWAAEESGHMFGRGFVPTSIEHYFYLIPSVQRWCIKYPVVWVRKVLVGWLDPVDFIITDPVGRKMGHANGTTYDEIPGAFYTGDEYFEMFGIADKIDGDYTIELFGLGEDYQAEIKVIDPNGLVLKMAFSGYMDAGESLLEIIPDNNPPTANAGGPYVAQATGWNGASIALNGTESSDPDGNAMTYQWDLDLSADSDGDGNADNDVDSTDASLIGAFPVGQTEISLVVTDEYGIASEPDITTVTVSFLEVDVDIKPGSFPNSINLGSNGVIPVAFLTDSGFDASTIDPATVTLRGQDFTDGIVKLKGKKGASRPMANLEDVDNDGDLDLLVHLVTEKLADYGLETICELGALTYDGYVVSGSDSIQIVPE